MIKIGEITAYTLEEAAEKINASIVTLRNYIKQGKLEAHKVAGKWYIREENLTKLFNNGVSSKKHQNKRKK